MSIRSARTTDQHPEPTDHLYNAGLGRTFLRSRGAQIGRVMDAITTPNFARALVIASSLLSSLPGRCVDSGHLSI